MTRLDELEKVKKHLSDASTSLSSAMRGAVLSRRRRASYDRLQIRILEEMLDVDEELQRRATHSEGIDK